VGATSAVASHPAVTTAAAGWGTAQEVAMPSSAASGADADAQVNSVSCVSVGNCVAGGYYSDTAFNVQAFVADETNGSWAAAQEVPGTATFNVGGNAQVLSVSCVSTSDCVAGGLYTDSSGHQQAFVADETSGSWGMAQEVQGSDTFTFNAGGSARILSVSCASAGNCAAGGYYKDSSGHTQAFVVNESGSVWGSAAEVLNSGTLNAGGTAQVTSVSCASAGNCTAGGYYTDSSSHTQAFVVDESSGSWGTAEEVPGLANPLNVGGGAEVVSVSCGSAGNCVAGGYYTDSSGHTQAFVVDESSGSWGTAEEVPGSATLNADGNAQVTSVSCASAGNCVAGGSYLDSSSHQQAFVVDESSGVWGTAEEVPGSATLNAGGTAGVASVSCASAGNCVAGGSYVDSSSATQLFVVDETSGTWGTAEEMPGSATLNTNGLAAVASTSCASVGYCAAGGYYSVFAAGTPQQAFVDDVQLQLVPSTSTSLSAAAASDGLELTATVLGPAGSTASPAGTVTFKDGSASLGSATLKASGNGKATATVTDHSLPAGANDFSATFSPSDAADFTGSSGTLDENLPVAVTWVQPGSPTISGTAAVGDTLTVKPGTWGPSGVRLAYQWYANGSAISGATGATLGLGTSEYGKKITVTVTGFETGDVTVAATSPDTGTVGKGTLRSSTPKITGTAKVGDTLKVSLGTWTSGTGFAYQWLASGKAISKATGSSLKLATAEKGKRISVRVTGSKTDYNPVTKTSAQTGTVAG
jgi:hypothetical protein